MYKKTWETIEYITSAAQFFPQYIFFHKNVIGSFTVNLSFITINFINFGMHIIISDLWTWCLPLTPLCLAKLEDRQCCRVKNGWNDFLRFGRKSLMVGYKYNVLQWYPFAIGLCFERRYHITERQVEVRVRAHDTEWQGGYIVYKSNYRIYYIFSSLTHSWLHGLHHDMRVEIEKKVIRQNWNYVKFNNHFSQIMYSDPIVPAQFALSI